MPKYYKVETFMDAEGREIQMITGPDPKGPVDLEADAVHDNNDISMYYAMVRVQSMVKVPVPTPQGVMPFPAVIVDKMPVPIPPAKSLDDAFALYDEVVGALKEEQQRQASQAKLVTAQSVPPAPKLELV